MQREPIKELFLAEALENVENWLKHRIEQKGDGSFSSLHELRGVLDEEYEELKVAFHSKTKGQIYLELMDLVVGGIFGLACMKAKTI